MLARAGAPLGKDLVSQALATYVLATARDGYQVEADFTVVWGRTPTDAPNIVANIGGVDKVRDNVIEPAMKAACGSRPCVSIAFRASTTVESVNECISQTSVAAALIAATILG